MSEDSLGGWTDPYGRTRDSLAARVDDFAPGLVSVVIPCFDMERFVAEAIESALGQTWPDIEVIVVDDGSTDRSREIIEGYGDRVIARFRDNAGACVARNDGLELARGEFIQFLDADDTLVPDAVERRIAAFAPGVGAVFGDRVHVTAEGRPARWALPPHSERVWESVGMIQYVLFWGMGVFEPLHRRGWVMRVGGFDEALPSSQEPDFHLRLLLAGSRFEYLPGVAGIQRHHAAPTRISNTAWWESGSKARLGYWRHRMALISAVDPGLVDGPFRDRAARRLISDAVHITRFGGGELARDYYREVVSLFPGYRPEGIPGVVVRLFGLWTAIRLGAWRIRVREGVRAVVDRLGGGR